MLSLRERGIYALPNGSEFVIHAVFRGGYVLYTREAWELFGAYAYESNHGGQIRSSEHATHWCTADLTDTSRTARSRSRDGAGQKPTTS